MTSTKKEDRYAIIYHTDKNWLNFLINRNLTNNVNFWTKNKLTWINKNQTRFPFFFKTSDGEIVGYSDYIEQKELTLLEAWNEFGTRNGVKSYEELKNKIRDTLKISDINDKTRINCTILNNLVIFSKPIKLEEIEIKGMQTDKYINKNLVDKILELSNLYKPGKDKVVEIELSEVKPEFRKSITKTRLFQTQLRKEVLKLYNEKCVICGIDNKILLNVSHIKPVNEGLEDAGKPENTLLLCKLHDAMFDKGLISIDKEGKIVISKQLESTKSEKLKKEINEIKEKKINLDLSKSKEFLNWHYNHNFK